MKGPRKYVNDPVSRMYDEMAEQQIVKTLRSTSRHFRASEADQCKRRQWYRMSGYRPAPNDGWLEHLGIQGDIDHDTSRDMLRHYGVELDGLVFTREDDGSMSVEETETHKATFNVDGTDVTIACRADGLIDIKDLLVEISEGKYEGDGWVLLEVKGMDGWTWRYANEAFKRGGMDAVKEYILEKKRSYVWQMMVTMKLVGQDKAYLLIKDRNMAQHGWHDPESGSRLGGGVYEFDPELWDRILKRFASIERAVKEGVPPRPEYADGSKPCTQCPFYYLCHGAFNRERLGLEPYIVYPVEGQEDFHDKGDQE